MTTHLVQLWIYATFTLLRQCWYIWHLRSHRFPKHEPAGLEVGFTATIALYVLYLSIWLLSLLGLAQRQASLVIFIPGSSLVLLGVSLRWLALRALGQHFRVFVASNSAVVTSGIYSIIRHPIHLGMLVELFGMALIARSALAWGMWLQLILVTLSLQRKEDGKLREHVGQIAQQYQAMVPAMNIIRGLNLYFSGH